MSTYSDFLKSVFIINKYLISSKNCPIVRKYLSNKISEFISGKVILPDHLNLDHHLPQKDPSMVNH